MTDTEPLPPPPAPATSQAWDTQFARLRERFRGCKDSILFCVHALQTGGGVDLAALKAQAEMHGLKVTGASLNAARRILMPPGDRPPLRRRRPAAVAVAPKPIASKRAPADDPIETLVRDVAARVRQAASAEADRLRQALQAALAVIDAALDD